MIGVFFGIVDFIFYLFLVIFWCVVEMKEIVKNFMMGDLSCCFIVRRCLCFEVKSDLNVILGI